MAVNTNEEVIEYFANGYEFLKDFSKQYWNDEALRARVDGGDMSLIREGLNALSFPEVELKLAANTRDVYHVVMPPDPNYALSDQELERVAAGGSTAGSASTAGSLGTIATSTAASSASSAGSVACAGSAS